MRQFIATGVALLSIAVSVAAIGAQTPGLFNVRQFGATGNGTSTDTAAINKTIETCADAGGGTVYVPAGTYLTGTVELKSNVTLQLASGATLLGSTNLADYRSAVLGQEWYDALVLAKDVHDVAIVGDGTIDGSNLRNPNGEEHIRGPHAVMFYGARNVTVRDISIRNSGNYNLIVRSSEGLTIDGLKVHGGWDGINMHDTLDATISNCRIYAGDDALAGAYWENVTVSNCILNAAANGIRVGGRNVLFANSVIYGPGLSEHGTSLRHHTEAGFQILPNGDGRANKFAKPGPVDNMVLSGLTMVNVGTPFFVAYSADAPYSHNNLGVESIIVNNLTVVGAGKTPFYISAPADNPAKHIVLNNVRMTFTGGATENDAEGQGFSPFSILQSYGVYARNVADFELHNVQVGFAAADARPALFGENIGALNLDRFEAQQGPGGAPSVELSGNTRLTVDENLVSSAAGHIADISLPVPPLFAGDPFSVAVSVVNTGSEGLVSVPLTVGSQTFSRALLLNAGEKANISFLNLRDSTPGKLSVASGEVAKQLDVQPLPVAQPVAPPFKTFTNVKAVFSRFGDSYYIRAAGDLPVMQYDDQYGAIYEEHALPNDGSIVVRLENPDLRTSWQGRVGIVVRADIGKAGSAGPYLILASSPAAGSYLEWATDGSGRLRAHTEFDGYTLWPHWLKLERHGTDYTGYSSSDGTHWREIGQAQIPAADGPLDAGIFAFRSSARFSNFAILQ
jgi:hypothetical protein